MGDYVMYGISADSIGLVINCPHWCLGLVVRATKPVRSVAVMGPHEPNTQASDLTVSFNHTTLPSSLLSATFFPNFQLLSTAMSDKLVLITEAI